MIRGHPYIGVHCGYKNRNGLSSRRLQRADISKWNNPLARCYYFLSDSFSMSSPNRKEAEMRRGRKWEKWRLPSFLLQAFKSRDSAHHWDTGELENLSYQIPLSIHSCTCAHNWDDGACSSVKAPFAPTHLGGRSCSIAADKIFICSLRHPI